MQSNERKAQDDLSIINTITALTENVGALVSSTLSWDAHKNRLRFPDTANATVRKMVSTAEEWTPIFRDFVASTVEIAESAILVLSNLDDYSKMKVQVTSLLATIHKASLLYEKFRLVDVEIQLHQWDEDTKTLTELLSLPDWLDWRFIDLYKKARGERSLLFIEGHLSDLDAWWTQKQMATSSDQFPSHISMITDAYNKHIPHLCLAMYPFKDSTISLPAVSEHSLFKIFEAKMLLLGFNDTEKHQIMDFLDNSFRPVVRSRLEGLLTARVICVISYLESRKGQIPEGWGLARSCSRSCSQLLELCCQTLIQIIRLEHYLHDLQHEPISFLMDPIPPVKRIIAWHHDIRQADEKVTEAANNVSGEVRQLLGKTTGWNERLCSSMGWEVFDHSIACFFRPFVDSLECFEFSSYGEETHKFLAFQESTDYSTRLVEAIFRSGSQHGNQDAIISLNRFIRSLVDADGSGLTLQSENEMSPANFFVQPEEILTFIPSIPTLIGLHRNELSPHYEGRPDETPQELLTSIPEALSSEHLICRKKRVYDPDDPYALDLTMMPSLYSLGPRIELQWPRPHKKQAGYHLPPTQRPDLCLRSNSKLKVFSNPLARFFPRKEKTTSFNKSLQGDWSF